MICFRTSLDLCVHTTPVTFSPFRSEMGENLVQGDPKCVKKVSNVVKFCPYSVRFFCYVFIFCFWPKGCPFYDQTWPSGYGSSKTFGEFRAGLTLSK